MESKRHVIPARLNWIWTDAGYTVVCTMQRKYGVMIYDNTQATALGASEELFINSKCRQDIYPDSQ